MILIPQLRNNKLNIELRVARNQNIFHFLKIVLIPYIIFFNSPFLNAILFHS